MVQDPQTTAPHTVVLTVGNSMMGDDGAGPLLFNMMSQKPIAGWRALDGGSVPENSVHIIRELAPQRLIIVDAADMEIEPGEIRLIDEEAIAEMFFMSTHNMPLNFLIEQLKEDIPDTSFLGIQPNIVSFAFPLGDEVRAAVETLYQRFATNNGVLDFPAV